MQKETRTYWTGTKVCESVKQGFILFECQFSKSGNVMQSSVAWPVNVCH